MSERSYLSEPTTWTLRESAERAPRDIYGKVLIQLARENERIVAISPDVMISTKVKDFAKEFPRRFWNTGISEQSAMAMAAGMATCGLIPFFSSFACFSSMRACEQIRTDIAYPKLNVKIVGTHAGLSTGKAGTTHHATEDIAIIRSMANMVVLVPSDIVQVEKILRCAVEYDGPCYIRLVRGHESPVMIYDTVEECPFEIGKAAIIKEGHDVTIIAAGAPAVHNSLLAANRLDKEGICVRLIDMASVKPIDKEVIVKAAEETGGIVTVEDHNIMGGLGGAVAEVLGEEKPTLMKRVGIPDIFSVIGPPDELWARYGLDPASLVETVRAFLNKIE